MLEYIDLKYKPDKNDLVLEYYVDSRIKFRKACEQIAAESSIGTWTDINTMNPEIAKKLKPHVFEIRMTGKNKGFIKIAYNKELFEPGSVPQLLSAIAGNIYGMKLLRNLRLIDIEFPKSYMKAFKGPKFGIPGVRKLFKIKDRPLVGTIVKPKVGLNPKQHAKVAYEAWVGGCDVVKDDENLTSMSFNKFEERLKETMKMKEKAEKVTGMKKGYMVNISAETMTMLKRMDMAKEIGNEYVMLDFVTLGFSAVQTVREHNEDLGLILHAHRAMHAALTKNKKHGITMLALAKLIRLIGMDQLHIGTAVGKMEGSKIEIREIEDEIEDNFFRQVLTRGRSGKSNKSSGAKTRNSRRLHFLEQDWYGFKPVFAVASGGLHPGLVPKLVDFLGKDIIIQAGGGIHGHPMGTRAGAKAMRQAIDSVMQGIPIREYAKKHKELKAAIQLWGA